MTQAKKALYATVGAGEAAVARVKSLPKQASEVRTRLTGGSLRDFPRTALDTVRTAPARIGEFVSGVTDVVGDLTGQTSKRVTKTYNTYAKRGEKLVRKVSKSAPSRRAVEKTRSAKSRTKAAATSVKSAVGADVEAVKQAAEAVTADVG